MSTEHRPPGMTADVRLLGTSEPPTLRASSVGQMLATAREYLGIDVVFLTHFGSESELFLLGEGDLRSFGPIAEGAELALTDSYCEQVVERCLPNVIPDTALNTVTRDMQITHSEGIGGYVGVPVHLSDGSLYGTLRCLSHGQTGPVSSQQLGVVRLVAELVAGEIERHHASDRVPSLYHRATRALEAPGQREDVLHEVLRAVGETLEATSVSLWWGTRACGVQRRASWNSSSDNGFSPELISAQAPGLVLEALAQARGASESARSAASQSDLGLAVPVAGNGRGNIAALELRGSPSAGSDHGVRTALENVAGHIGEFLSGTGDQAESLTPRELEVLEHAATGAAVEDIAQALYLSPTTVRTHLRSVYGKLGTPNRAGAVAEAMRQRLIA